MKTDAITTLKNQSTTLLADLNETKQPMRILEGIAKGEQAIRDDQMMGTQQAKEKMSKWLK